MKESMKIVLVEPRVKLILKYWELTISTNILRVRYVCLNTLRSNFHGYYFCGSKIFKDFISKIDMLLLNFTFISKLAGKSVKFIFLENYHMCTLQLCGSKFRHVGICNLKKLFASRNFITLVRMIQREYWEH